MCRCRHLSHAPQQVHIFRTSAEFIVSYHRCEGSATKDSELLFIDFLEQRTLVEFRCALQIFQKIMLRCIEDLDLQHDASFALVHQVLDATPCSLKLLERWVMQDLIQLLRDQLIDL